MILTVTMNPSIDISYPLDVPSWIQSTRQLEVSKTAGLNATVLSEIISRQRPAYWVESVTGSFRRADRVNVSLRLLEIHEIVSPSFTKAKGKQKSCEKGPNHFRKKAFP